MTWNILIQAELKALRFVQLLADKSGVCHVLDSIVSRYPLKDITLVVWFAFFAAIFDLGHHFFIVCGGNLLVALVLNVLIQAPRPVHYDVTLVPRTNRQANNHGFPSIETHMAVVVFGCIGYRITRSMFRHTIDPALDHWSEFVASDVGYEQSIGDRAIYFAYDAIGGLVNDHPHRPFLHAEGVGIHGSISIDDVFEARKKEEAQALNIELMGAMYASAMLIVIWLLLLAIVSLVGFSRIYAQARFIHQIVLSYVTGFLGLWFGIAREAELVRVLDHRVQLGGKPPIYFIAFMLAVAIGLVLPLALAIEANETSVRFLRVSYAEFAQVLREIMSYSPQDGDGDTDGVGSPFAETITPTPTGQGQGQKDMESGGSARVSLDPGAGTEARASLGEFRDDSPLFDVLNPIYDAEDLSLNEVQTNNTTTNGTVANGNGTSSVASQLRKRRRQIAKIEAIRARKDSFNSLQKTLEKRAMEKAAIRHIVLTQKAKRANREKDKEREAQRNAPDEERP